MGEANSISAGKEFVRMDTDLKAVKHEQEEIKGRVRDFDNSFERFWKELPSIISSSLKANFDGINRRLDRLEDQGK